MVTTIVMTLVTMKNNRSNSFMLVLLELLYFRQKFLKLLLTLFFIAKVSYLRLKLEAFFLTSKNCLIKTVITKWPHVFSSFTSNLWSHLLMLSVYSRFYFIQNILPAISWSSGGHALLCIFLVQYSNLQNIQKSSNTKIELIFQLYYTII